jgi:acetyl-CoA carboxylase biotin carboxyl carrier protein
VRAGPVSAVVAEVAELRRQRPFCEVPWSASFYRSPSPGAKSFVEVGDEIKAGETICISSAMKIPTKLSRQVRYRHQSEVITAVVEYGQPLFVIE